MSEILTWLPLIASLGAIITVAKFWMDMGATKRDATTASIRVETLATELNAFKSTVARDYAPVQALAAAEGRLASAIDGIRQDFRGITERIDRILSAMQQQGHG